MEYWSALPGILRFIENGINGRQISQLTVNISTPCTYREEFRILLKLLSDRGYL